MDVALDIEEFRSWFPGLTEAVINDVLLGVLWDQVGAIVGTTDADSFAPFDPDATPPVLERKVLLYYALCHMAARRSARSRGQCIRRLGVVILRSHQEQLAVRAVVESDALWVYVLDDDGQIPSRRTPVRL